MEEDTYGSCVGMRTSSCLNLGIIFNWGHCLEMGPYAYW